METFKELLVRSVEQFGSGIAFTLKEGKDRYTDISFIRFYEEVKSLATAFISRGFSGERIAVTGKNSYHWFTVEAPSVRITYPSFSKFERSIPESLPSAR